jgi:hypothetical protein
MVNTSPRPWLAPSWCCALVTIAAAPVSFVGVLCATPSDPKDLNPAAIAFYLCLSVALILPLALVNSFLIAPCVAKMACGRLPAVVSHLILVIVWAALVLSGYLVVPRLPAALDWVMLFWNLTMLLGPAVIAGSFVYSLKYNWIRRKSTLCA